MTGPTELTHSALTSPHQLSQFIKIKKTARNGCLPTLTKGNTESHMHKPRAYRPIENLKKGHTMRAIDYIRLLSLAAIWGASFLFMRIAGPAIGAINTAFFRVFFGFIGLAVIIFFIRKSLKFRGKLGKILILGAINSGIPFLMYSIAATLLPAGRRHPIFSSTRV
ncbi:DMT family transporter [Halomonas sp. hl-4]|uniref:DMT family transporter n=1 Tax=Halomonas sp. hl-4 TaxID=1761789 RepID=UPI002F908D60